MAAFSRILLIGAGTMGQWVSMKIAEKYKITVVDQNSDALEMMRRIIPEGLKEKFSLLDNLEEGARGADLILEMVPEDPDIKRKLYEELDAVAQKSSVLTSNSSILLPGDFCLAERRKPYFSHFHFYMPNTVVEIMPTEGTKAEVIGRLERFAKAIGETPIVIKKPSRGFIFSAIAGAATDVALALLHDEVASVETVDASWRAITKTALGPFQQLDMIGLDTSLRIRQVRLVENGSTKELEKAILVLEKKVQDGDLGRKTGKGFYSY